VIRSGWAAATALRMSRVRPSSRVDHDQVETRDPGALDGQDARDRLGDEERSL
jgi:hypothetical protein